MKKLQSTILNMTLVLTIIAIVAGGALASVNSITSKQIEKIKAEKLQKGIKEVLGISLDKKIKVEEKTEGNFVFYSTTKGIAVRTTQNGFGGPIEVLVGFDNEGTIKGYQILSHSETPGLGAKAGEWFQKGNKGDIIGKNPSNINLTVSKDGGDIDAITASTITSRAFLSAVKNAYDALSSNKTDAQTSATKQNKKEGGEE